VQHRCSELTLRAPASSEGCRCIAISSTALKRALVEFPEDRERLRGLLNMVSQQIDGPRRVLAAVQFSESFMQIAAHSLTRHILMPGEYVFREGQRHPDGIVFLRCGRLALEVQGVVVRHVNQGQVIGEELFLDVCQKWATTARCVAPCEVPGPRPSAGDCSCPGSGAWSSSTARQNASSSGCSPSWRADGKTTA